MVEHLGAHWGTALQLSLEAAKESVRDTAGAGAVFYPTASMRGDLAHRVTLDELGGVGSEARHMGRGIISWDAYASRCCGAGATTPSGAQGGCGDAGSC